MSVTWAYTDADVLIPQEWYIATVSDCPECPSVPFALDSLLVRWNFIDSLHDVDIADLRVKTLVLTSQQTGSCVCNRLTVDMPHKDTRTMQ